MSYTAVITNTLSQETREYEFPDFVWDDDDEFLWTEGNFGCDCNRSLFFARAAEVPEDNTDASQCGSILYRVSIRVGDKLVYEEAA